MDVIWAQYCLFLFIKLHDDVFDTHTDRKVLLYAGDALSLEAQHTFLKYFDARSRFWPFYFSSLSQTLNAIVTVDQSQLGRPVPHRKIAQTYAKGYSACKISLFAVCLRSGSQSLFPKLSRFFDQLAITGQLLDDVEDIRSDLQRGRLNYAAYCLSGKQKLKPGKLHPLEAAMTRNVLLNGAADRFFGLLQGHLHLADKISKTLSIPELSDCVRSYRNTVACLESETHRKRVSILLAKDSRTMDTTHR